MEAFWILLVIVGIGAAMWLYFLPARIATNRKHRNASAIGMLNLLTGWTVIGWVAALVWAFTVAPEAEQPVSKPKPEPKKEPPDDDEPNVYVID